MNYTELLKKPEYDFLREMNRDFLFLCVSGSRAYGTNRPDSDVDLRGCVYNTPAEMLGLEKFDCFDERNTDTKIFGLNKMLQLWINNNPESLELLGCRPCDYVYLSDKGKLLLDNSQLFLSKRAGFAYGGFVGTLFRELQRYLAMDISDTQKLENLYRSADHLVKGFQMRYAHATDETFQLHVDEDPAHPGIYVDIQAKGIPLQEFNGMCNELSNIRDHHKQIKDRKEAKDEKHLNKQIAHLFRAYFMAFDILENQKIVVYREKEIDFLKEALNGRFLDHGNLTPEFFSMMNAYEERLHYAAKYTELPDKPDVSKIKDLAVNLL